MGVRELFLGISVLPLGACTSFDASKTVPKPEIILPVNGLAAQELASGECGVFLWTQSLPRTFIFFQKQGNSRAKYYATESEITVSTSQNTNNMGDGTSLDIAYSHADYKTFHVKGEFTDVLEGGLRISNARIKSQKPDQWEEIQPVSGVFVCR